MNFKLPLIIVALAVVALGLIMNVKNQDEQEIQEAQETQDIQDIQEPQNYVAVWDTTLVQAKLPILNINGKKNPDVYLQSLDIQVEVTGNIASTRYTMVFKNKTNRILEGELTFPLPDGRTVTHYALDINGKMRDAVPVEKARATEVFEEIERRGVDPGLLERVEGNNFRTRIYPFFADGTRTISIGYEEELTLENGLLYYRLPMAYPDLLEKFSVKATVLKSNQKPLVPESGNELSFDKAGENYVASLSHKNYRSSQALNFALPTPANIPRVIVQSAQGSHYFFASVAPKMEMRKKQWDNDLAIIWDVSLSGSQRNLQREIEMLDIIFSENKNAKASLYFLNNTFKKIAKGNWKELKSILEKAVYDGGTDFSKINLKEIEGNEILFFSDGISTLSGADFIENAKVNLPVHCIVSSAKADYNAMKFIAGKTKGKFINVNALSLEKLKDELLNETLLFLGTEHGKTVREVYPSVATPVHGNFSIAGISEANDAELTLLFGFGSKVEKRIKVKLDAKNNNNQGNVYKIWAQKKIAELDLNYEKNRTELAELGKQFGIVTRNTSLIVLETLADYIRYNIEPPATEPELRTEYQQRAKSYEKKEQNMLNEAVEAAKSIKEWWNTDFQIEEPEIPEDYSPKPKIEHSDKDKDKYRRRLLSGAGGKPRGKSQRAIYDDDFYDEESIYMQQLGIVVKPIKKDYDYLKELTGETAQAYQIYLKLRNDYANSPTFYFNVAEWFYKLGNKEIALRILTSIADLELENASLYRLLGYKFKEYGEYALEKFVCQKVIQWRPMEPQSYRDYALALADNGERQAALDSLYSLLTKTYSKIIIEHSMRIVDVVVVDINHLIAKKPHLNTSKIDKRLIMKIPVDIRIVINWNTNTRVNLGVESPHGLGRIGELRNGNYNSYGPKQFLLKKGIYGEYRIYVDSAVPSTVMAEIFIKDPDKTEQHQVISLQLSRRQPKDLLKFEF